MEIRYINQTFTANQATFVPVGGRYFRVLSNTNPFVLEVVGPGGQALAKLDDARTGDAGRCRADQSSFSGIRVTTTGTETVKIVVTDGEVWRDSSDQDVSDRAGRLLGIVYGTLGQLVQLALNGVNLLRVHPVGAKFADDHTAANEAFAAYHRQTAVAAANTVLQLMNPAGSGVIVYVDSMTVNEGLVGALSFALYNTALATDDGAGVSLDSGGAAAVAHVRRTTNAGALGTAFRRERIVAGYDYEYKFDPPVRLGAGEGLVLNWLTVNQDQSASWRWRERAV